jgi:hypothetical protein
MRGAQASQMPIAGAQAVAPIANAQAVRSNDVCAICMEPCVDAVIGLECGHAFHGVCVARWFRRNPACPMCRDVPDNVRY